MSPTQRIAQALPEHQHASLAPSSPACLPETFITQNPTRTPNTSPCGWSITPKRVTHEHAALVNGGMFRSCACKVTSAREGSGHVVVLVVFGGDHVVTLLWSLEVTDRGSVHTCEQG